MVSVGSLSSAETIWLGPGPGAGGKLLAGVGRNQNELVEQAVNGRARLVDRQHNRLAAMLFKERMGAI